MKDFDQVRVTWAAQAMTRWGWRGQPGSQCSELSERARGTLRLGSDGEDGEVTGSMGCD